MFSLLPSETEENGPNGRFGVPTVEDWQSLWVAWDFVTMRMMPCSMLYQKPIYLRHICLFYLGHIPTFLDIHLSRLLNEPHTQPEEFKVSATIFLQRNVLRHLSISISLRYTMALWILHH